MFDRYWPAFCDVMMIVPVFFGEIRLIDSIFEENDIKRHSYESTKAFFFNFCILKGMGHDINKTRLENNSDVL